MESLCENHLFGFEKMCLMQLWHVILYCYRLHELLHIYNIAECVWLLNNCFSLVKFVIPVSVWGILLNDLYVSLYLTDCIPPNSFP